MPYKGLFARGLLVSLLLVLAASCTDKMPAEFPVPEFSLKSPNTDMVADNDTIAGHPAVLYWFTSW